MHELFAAHVRRGPDAVALITPDGRLTYGELDRRAQRVANQLCRVAAAPAVVGLYVERGPAAVVGMLAILQTGAAYLPLDPADPIARTELMLEQSQAHVVLTTRALAARLPPGTERVVMDANPDGDGLVPPTASPVSGAASALSPAYVMYTSGSTGTPKGVCVPHRAIVRLVVNTDYVRLGPDEVILHAAPLTFDASTFEIWGALLNGATLVIPPVGTLSVRDITHTLLTYGVTTAWLPSVLFREVVRHDPHALAGLRQLVTGGDVVSADAVRAAFAAAPDVTIVNGYGPTEATTFSCAHVMTAAVPLGETVPIGRPIANTAAYVLDERMSLLPPHVAGELYIGGDGLALGYVNDPDLTARAFVPDRFSADPRARLYRTGDRAVLLEDGSIDFRGRIDRQIKVRGFRVELGDVEAILAAHPLVRDAVAVPRVGPAGDRQIIAYVTPGGELADPRFEEPNTIDDRIAQWRRLYDGVIYDGVGRGAGSGDPEFNTQGWKSSYTGSLIPEPEMREQVEQTVSRILESKPRSVLEIGCGLGMLLFRLRPHCERYVGTDFSPIALDYVERHLASAHAACRTSLHRAEAKDLSAVAGERFDVVVLNSIAQHFPTADYLRALLVDVMNLVVDGGRIFLGDLRSKALLPLFHLSVLLHQDDGSIPLRDAYRRVARRVAAERELALDPGFFDAAGLPRLSGVRVELKRGHSGNEMTKFRYDVSLLVAGPVPRHEQRPVLRWGADVGSLDRLDSLLRNAPPEGVEIRSIPNRRCELERQIWQHAARTSGETTLGAARYALTEAARCGSVDPEQLWALGARHGADVRIGWSAGPELGHYDATFVPAGQPPSHRGAAPADHASIRSQASMRYPWRQHANKPMAGVVHDKLASELRRYLSVTMPAHMIPAFVMVLDALPVTDNGKIDIAGLPQPERVLRDAPARDHAENSTAAKLATIWERLLGTWPADEDSLFELGGNSLTVIQLVSRIEDVLGIRISPAAVFQRPTLAGLVELLDAGDNDPIWPAAAAGAQQRGLRRRARMATRRPDAP